MRRSPFRYRLFRFLGVLTIVLVLVVLLGPRVHVKVPVPESTGLSRIDEVVPHLMANENQYPLIPGTEKTVVWFDQENQQTEYSVVYVHGFSASRQECMPIPEEIAKALGANLFLTRLTAHGMGPDAFLHVTAGDWLADAQEAVAIGKLIGKRVIMMGTSTGGTLSFWASRSEPDVAAVIMYSPNFGVPDSNAKYALYPWGLQICKSLLGPYYEFPAKNDLHARYWTTRYRTEGAVQMLALVDFCSKQDYSTMQTPCLGVYAEYDSVIDTGRVARQMEKLANHQTVVWPGSQHGIAGDILAAHDNEALIETTLNFLHANLK